VNRSLKIFLGIAILILAIAIAFLFLQQNPSKAILGKWHSRNDPQEDFTEFKNNGVFYFSSVTHAGVHNDRSFTNILRGNYRFIDQNHLWLKINYQNGASPFVITNPFRITGDTMEMKMENQADVSRLDRIK